MTNNSDHSPASLETIVNAVRSHTGVTGKQAINGASQFVNPNDPIHGPGDDGAIVDIAGQQVVACGEAISPPFVKGDPYGAGIAAILANVNDVAAMGGVPRGIVNTVVGSKEMTREIMRGMSDAAKMYDVPIIGGHPTESESEIGLSAFAVGHAEIGRAHV